MSSTDNNFSSNSSIGLLSNSSATRNNRFITQNRNKIERTPIPDWLIKLRCERKLRLLLSQSNDQTIVASSSNVLLKEETTLEHKTVEQTSSKLKHTNLNTNSEQTTKKVNSEEEQEKEFSNLRSTLKKNQNEQLTANELIEDDDLTTVKLNNDKTINGLKLDWKSNRTKCNSNKNEKSIKKEVNNEITDRIIDNNDKKGLTKLTSPRTNTLNEVQKSTDDHSIENKLQQNETNITVNESMDFQKNCQNQRANKVKNSEEFSFENKIENLEINLAKSNSEMIRVVKKRTDESTEFINKQSAVSQNYAKELNFINKLEENKAELNEFNYNSNVNSVLTTINKQNSNKTKQINSEMYQGDNLEQQQILNFDHINKFVSSNEKLNANYYEKNDRFENHKGLVVPNKNHNDFDCNQQKFDLFKFKIENRELIEDEKSRIYENLQINNGIASQNPSIINEHSKNPNNLKEYNENLKSLENIEEVNAIFHAKPIKTLEDNYKQIELNQKSNSKLNLAMKEELNLNSNQLINETKSDKLIDINKQPNNDRPIMITPRRLDKTKKKQVTNDKIEPNHDDRKNDQNRADQNQKTELVEQQDKNSKSTLMIKNENKCNDHFDNNDDDVGNHNTPSNQPKQNSKKKKRMNFFNTVQNIRLNICNRSLRDSKSIYKSKKKNKFK